MVTSPPTVKQFARALSVVGQVVEGILPEQWSSPTPCTDWNVRELVVHLVGMNLVFTAILSDQPPPVRGEDPLGEDPAGAYRKSASTIQAAFEQEGVLERVYSGPLGEATGVERMQIRIYDLLAHGWDLARATGQPAEIPDDLAEQALLFVQSHLPAASRGARFGPTQNVPDYAPAIDRLVAFLGRPVDAGEPR